MASAGIAGLRLRLPLLSFPADRVLTRLMLPPRGNNTHVVCPPSGHSETLFYHVTVIGINM